MKSILEELWYGNIRPYESGIHNTPKFKELLGCIAQNSRELDTTLSDEQKKLLEKFMDSHSDFNALSESVIFIYGFRLGAQLMLEVLSGAEV